MDGAYRYTPQVIPSLKARGGEERLWLSLLYCSAFLFPQNMYWLCHRRLDILISLRFGGEELEGAIRRTFRGGFDVSMFRMISRSTHLFTSDLISFSPHNIFRNISLSALVGKLANRGGGHADANHGQGIRRMMGLRQATLVCKIWQYRRNAEWKAYICRCKAIMIYIWTSIYI